MEINYGDYIFRQEFNKVWYDVVDNQTQQTGEGYFLPLTITDFDSDNLVAKLVENYKDKYNFGSNNDITAEELETRILESDDFMELLRSFMEEVDDSCKLYITGFYRKALSDSVQRIVDNTGIDFDTVNEHVRQEIDRALEEYRDCNVHGGVATAMKIAVRQLVVER